MFTNYKFIDQYLCYRNSPKCWRNYYNGRMDTFLNKHDILSPSHTSQYGFRSNMSTSHALLQLVEEITSLLDNKKKYSVGIFIDLTPLITIYSLKNYIFMVFVALHTNGY